MASKEYIQKANEKYREMLVKLPKTVSTAEIKQVVPAVVDKRTLEYEKCGSWIEGDIYCSNHEIKCGKGNTCPKAHMRRDYRMIPGDSSNGEVKDWDDFSF
jgi:hypothetical protein